MSSLGRGKTSSNTGSVTGDSAGSLEVGLAVDNRSGNLAKRKTAPTLGGAEASKRPRWVKGNYRGKD